MITKKIAIYDRQHYFYRFLKIELKNKFNLVSIKNFNFFSDLENDFATIIFVIYSNEELVNLMRIYKKGIPLIVCTFNKDLFLKISLIDEILLLDISKMKAEVKLELESYLSLTTKDTEVVNG